jgi:AcrR family transcriptional regulator
MVRATGLAGLSLRDLARRVGMQAPSLYSYFDSKNAIYDAMFAQGAQAFLDLQRGLEPSGDPLEDLQAGARLFHGFCTEDPARYQLLFQRTIPGFEPTPETYAIAVEVLDLVRRRLATCGVTDPEALDLWTAMGSGLTDQQISNDPGGDRWTRLVDEAVEMFYDHTTKRSTRKKGRARR